MMGKTPFLLKGNHESQTQSDSEDSIFDDLAEENDKKQEENPATLNDKEHDLNKKEESINLV